MDSFRSEMKKCLSVLKQTKNKEVQIFHHNDTDGIASACILQLAFEKKGYKIERTVALEKPYPKILENILSQNNKIIVFTDICGRIGNIISGINKSKNLVIILDHHVATKPKDPKVFNLDCDFFGIKGDSEMSASSVCYSFAEEMNGSGEVQKWSLVGILGAIGDGHFEDGVLIGENKRILDIAEKAHLVKWNGSEYVNSLGESLLVITNKIDVLGAAGYLDNVPSECVKLLKDNLLCSFSENHNLNEKFKELEKFQNKVFEDCYQNMEKISVQKGDVLMVDVGDTFKPMGVKMIGVFLHELSSKYSEKFKGVYLLGSQNIPPTVPGFKELKLPKTKKISGRVTSEMKSKIEKGKVMPLDLLLPHAAKEINGFSDACHPHSAAVVIDDDKLESFTEKCVDILKGGKGVGFGFGYGKTILCGGDCGFLMWGVNGIVGALPYETVALVEPLEKSEITPEIKLKGFLVADKRTEVPGYKKHKSKMQDDSVRLQLQHFGLLDRIKENPILITFRGSLLAASGDGASAAHCVSLSRALNSAFKLNLDDHGINKGGWIGEHSFHGSPSGVDNTVSTFGGLIDISFDRKTQVSKFEKVVVKPVEIVLAHSGVNADTSTLLGICTKLKEKNQELFDSQISEIKKSVSLMRKYFEEGDYFNMGKEMIENHKTIIKMGLSNERVIELCNIGLKAGAVGAKVTGGGLGGYVLFLTPTKELQIKVKNEMEKHGGKAIIAVKWPSDE